MYVVKMNGVGEGVRVGKTASFFIGELLRKNAPSNTRANTRSMIRRVSFFIVLFYYGSLLSLAQLLRSLQNHARGNEKKEQIEFCYTFLMTPLDAFHQLSYYTLSHKQEEFIHQYVVDAFAVQTADKDTKSIKINFGLIGLYLHLEKGFSGKEVQRAHMQFAKYKEKLPAITLPENRGEITVFDVLQTTEGEERDRKIEDWMQSVWNAYKNEQQKIKDFLEKYMV